MRRPVLFFDVGRMSKEGMGPKGMGTSILWSLPPLRPRGIVKLSSLLSLLDVPKYIHIQKGKSAPSLERRPSSWPPVPRDVDRLWNSENHSIRVLVELKSEDVSGCLPVRHSVGRSPGCLKEHGERYVIASNKMKIRGGAGTAGKCDGLGIGPCDTGRSAPKD